MERKVDHDELVGMLRAAARDHGLTLEEFYDLGRADSLDAPLLRDLWLIWGDELTEDDLERPVPVA